MSGGVRRRGLLALLVLALGGCQGLGSAEIASESIALRYLDVEPARRRAEALAEAQHGPAPTSEGVARVDAIAGYFKQLMGVDEGPPEARGEFAGRLALLDPRSGDVEMVRAARPGAVPRDWSADRQHLLFGQLHGEYMQLFELNVGTGDLRQVTRGPDVHPGGCYGPEGRLALVTATVEGNRAISRIDLTGPGGLDPRRITEGPFDRAVACAPDGSSIAWVADDERGREWIVTRAPVVDGEPRRIAPGRAPAYTPDGRWIVYSAPTGRGRELYRIRPDGGGRAPIGRRIGDELQPSVSPDGRLVVYVGEDEYHRRLFVRRIDGTGDRILLGTGDGEYPTW